MLVFFCAINEILELPNSKDSIRDVRQKARDSFTKLLVSCLKFYSIISKLPPNTISEECVDYLFYFYRLRHFIDVNQEIFQLPNFDMFKTILIKTEKLIKDISKMELVNLKNLKFKENTLLVKNNLNSDSKAFNEDGDYLEGAEFVDKEIKYDICDNLEYENNLTEKLDVIIINKYNLIAKSEAGNYYSYKAKNILFHIYFPKRQIIKGQSPFFSMMEDVSFEVSGNKTKLIKLEKKMGTVKK
jgi:hypothetical protein